MQTEDARVGRRPSALASWSGVLDPGGDPPRQHQTSYSLARSNGVAPRSCHRNASQGHRPCPGEGACRVQAGNDAAHAGDPACGRELLIRLGRASLQPRAAGRAVDRAVVRVQLRRHRSPEAKALGIGLGDPWFKVEPRARERASSPCPATTNPTGTSGRQRPDRRADPRSSRCSVPPLSFHTCRCQGSFGAVEIQGVVVRGGNVV